MTPLTIKALLQAPVNKDLLAIMQEIYAKYTPEELGSVIGYIRATAELEALDCDLETAIAQTEKPKKSRKSPEIKEE